MHSLLRPIASVLAIFAMLLRAAVPDGWKIGAGVLSAMPVPTPIAPCEGQGIVYGTG